MADTASETGVPVPDWSARRAWTAVIVAALIVVSGMVALESINRAMLRSDLGRDPADWTDPQVRALLQVHNLPLDRFMERGNVLREVANMRPSGEVTAQALWQYGALEMDFDDHAGKAIRLLQALEAAPDDSPRLSIYFVSYTRQLGELGKLEEIRATAWETLQRTDDPKVRERVVSSSVHALRSYGGTAQAIAIYEEVIHRYPDLATAGGARLEYAKALASAGRVDEARAAMKAIIATGDEHPREWAREALRDLDGGDDE